VLGYRPTLQANELELKLQTEQRHFARSQHHLRKLASASSKTSEELAVLKRRSILLVQKLNKRAITVDQIDSELTRLKTEMKKKKKNLRQIKSQLAVALGALQRIARMPTMAIIIVPRNPFEISKSAKSLKTTVSQLKTKTTLIHRDLQHLFNLAKKQKEEKKLVLAELNQMAAYQQQIAAIVSKKLRMVRSVHAEEKHASTKIVHTATHTSNLRELLGKLSKNKLTRNDTALTPSTRFLYRHENKVLRVPVRNKGVFLPVSGRVVQTFGAILSNGTKSKGISIATRPSAVVVAPETGRIVFAGRFRGYGELLIVELPKQGYALIAGMKKINPEVGDQVLIGEPLGEMPASTLSVPKLYFELRKNGQPINPMPKTSVANHKAPGQG
tara:strand:- start:1089 stop:2246 length:1158 start_codon:yes stop_codon:yes gene_type:complete